MNQTPTPQERTGEAMTATPPAEGTIKPHTQINALLTEQGVNMGDHGQDVTRAVVLDPNETVSAMIDRLFPEPGRWSTDRRPDLRLTIRVAVSEDPR